MIHTGDCVTVMAGMEPASVDAIVTDPPYGLEFMGKGWDKLGAGFEVVDEGADRSHPFRDGTRRVRYGASASSMQRWHEQWAREAFRVARPSAYLLAFGGTRTVHRLACAIEDAGWIIRDQVVWIYAQGFPKSKACLKPAMEPIVLARKPGPLRDLAIDKCRIPLIGGEAVDDREGEPTADVRYGDKVRATPGRRLIVSKSEPSLNAYGDGLNGLRAAGTTPLGRWPSNVILTDAVFDGGVPGVVGGGETTSGFMVAGPKGDSTWFADHGLNYRDTYGDSGTYSRFFLIPKADRADREPILGTGAGRVVSVWGGDEDDLTPGKKSTIARRNHHPTVKPVDLMRHLVRLVTPTGGTVLDPFLGSGTTAIAAEMEGFAWIGIEREPEYVAIAEARLNGTQRGLGLETA